MRAATLASLRVVAAMACSLWAAGCSVVTRPPAGELSPFGHARHSHVPTSSAIDSAVPAPPVSTAEIAIAAGDAPFQTSHPRVQGFLDAYRTRLRDFLALALQRASKYLPMMESILAKEGVPPELAYVTLVESGFRLHAASPAGAVGPWQFVRGTGRRYGLRIDGYVDERRDPVKATRAAARYFRDLYDTFGDWHLSLAAYNRGEAKISRIRDWQKIDDYWEMSARGYLPRETMSFVPRVLAAMEIGRAPEEYGFDVAPDPPAGYDLMNIDRAISLQTVAELSGSDVATISELNPALRRGVVPPEGYVVRLPKGTRSRFEIGYAQWKHQPESPSPARRVARSIARTHRVRRGESPGSIARRHGVSVTALMRANRIRDPRAVAIGRVLQVPVIRSEPAQPGPVAVRREAPTPCTLN